MVYLAVAHGQQTLCTGHKASWEKIIIQLTSQPIDKHWIHQWSSVWIHFYLIDIGINFAFQIFDQVKLWI